MKGTREGREKEGEKMNEKALMKEAREGGMDGGRE